MTACALGFALVAAAPAGAAIEKYGVIFVNFSDNGSAPIAPATMQANLITGAKSVKNFYTDSTYGGVTIAADELTNSASLTGYYTLPTQEQNCSDQFGNWATQAKSMAQADGHDLSGYSRFIFVFPSPGDSSCPGPAWADSIGGNTLWTTLSDPAILAHEIGHTLGLTHDHSLGCSAGSQRVSMPANNVGTCFGITNTFLNYEGDWSVMTSNGAYHLLNALQRYQLGALPASAVTTIAAPGDYTLTALNSTPSAGHPQLLRIPVTGTDDGYGHYRAFEFRGTKAPFDAMDAPHIMSRSVIAYDYTAEPPGTPVDGFQIDPNPSRFGNPDSGVGCGYDGSSYICGAFASGFLEAGQTLYDPVANTTVELLGTTATTATVRFMNGSLAGAGSAYVSGDTLFFRSVPGQVNDVGISIVGSDYIVVDNAAPVTPGAGCTAMTANKVKCPSAGVTKVDADTGDMDDGVAVYDDINSKLSGGPGNDVLIGSGGDDFMNGGSGDDIFVPNGGYNTVDYSERTAPLDIHIGQPQDHIFNSSPNGVALGGAAGETDRVIGYGGTGFQKAIGGSGNDTISSAPSDALWTTTLEGGPGNDTLSEISGDAILDGGPGSDTLNGGPNNDLLRAVDGQSDTVNCANSTTTAQVDATDNVNGCALIVNPPTTSVTSGPSEGQVIGTTSPAFTFASNAAGATFECSRDQLAWSACASPTVVSFGSASDGAHSFRVRAIDSHQLVDQSPAQIGFTIDTLPPSVSITAPANGSSTSLTSPSLSFSATDNSSHVEQCKVDAGVFAACTATIGPLSAGAAHTVSVKSTDAAGNSSTAVSSFTVLAPTSDPPPAEQPPTGQPPAEQPNPAAPQVLQASVLSTSHSQWKTPARLTSEGTVDWSHWGGPRNANWNHKRSAQSRISNLAPASASGACAAFKGVTGASPPSQWSDGIPRASANGALQATAISAGGPPGCGFALSIGDLTNAAPMKLRLYVGVIAANAQLQLSWASQPTSLVSDKSFTGSAKKVKNGVYSIDLRPPVANDALNVKWVLSTSPRPHLSRVRLYSATLSAG